LYRPGLRFSLHVCLSVSLLSSSAMHTIFDNYVFITFTVK
jgi:hypothetical protein